MEKLLLVFLGGGVGSSARYLVGLGALRWLGPSFPWATLTVNTLGSLLLGLLLGHGSTHPGTSEHLRLVLGTGVMGGFTTYSSFNAETVRMLESGTYGIAALYAGTTFVLCLMLGAAGVWLGRV